MGLLIGLADYGIGDLMDRAQALYDLLFDLCQDQLSWENILDKPELYEKSETYSKEEVDLLLAALSGVDLPINISDVNMLADALNARYTKVEIDALLLNKANKVHQHVVADISDLDAYLSGSGIQIVSELPATIEEGKVYLVAPTGGSVFQLFLGLPGNAVMPLNAITADEFAIGLATKQQKLSGPANQVTMADGSYGPFDKTAIGLSNIPNLPPNLWPISDAVANALNNKANQDDVLTKDGDQTKTSGVLTFMVSPEVPTASQNSEAVNLGQVQGLMSDLSNAVSHPLEVEFTTPATTWEWVHGRAITPIFDIIIGGKRVDSKVSHDDPTKIVITFKSPQTGKISVR